MNKRVRAVIVDNASLLLIHRIKGGNEYWVFPGGGLEESDSTPEAGLKRECLEELGVEVDVVVLFTEKPSADQIELYYTCRIVGGTLGTGNGPERTRDPKQFGTYELQWVPFTDLATKNVYPPDVRDKVLQV